MAKLQKYFSILLVFLFLSPQLEKGVHDYLQRNDFHCSTTDIHFHNTEHHCGICDYVFPFSSGQSFQDYSLKNQKIASKKINLYSETVYTTSPSYFFSLRAPPVFC